MNIKLSSHPQLLSFLEAARHTPEDNTPRLVLADWLEGHDDAIRAEFIRLQCRLAPGSPPLEQIELRDLEAQCQQLLSRHGGGWLGPLWQYWLSPLSWHRGLLATQMPRHLAAADLADILPWIDTALFRITASRNFRRIVALLAGSGINHLYLDVRRGLGEETLLEELAGIVESPYLRSITIAWPPQLLREHVTQGQRGFSCTPVVTDGFLRSLLTECPLGRHLTHLGSSWPFANEQAGMIRHIGVEPVHAQHRLWMHTVAPSCFQRRSSSVQQL